MKPQLEEVDKLPKDVLEYLSACDVTSLSIQGNI